MFYLFKDLDLFIIRRLSCIYTLTDVFKARGRRPAAGGGIIQKYNVCIYIYIYRERERER